MANPWDKDVIETAPQQGNPWDKDVTTPPSPAASSASSTAPHSSGFLGSFWNGLKTFRPPLTGPDYSPEGEQAAIDKFRNHPGEYLMDQVPFAGMVRDQIAAHRAGVPLASRIGTVAGETLAGMGGAPPFTFGNPFMQEQMRAAEAGDAAREAASAAGREPRPWTPPQFQREPLPTPSGVMPQGRPVGSLQRVRDLGLDLPKPPAPSAPPRVPQWQQMGIQNSVSPPPEPVVPITPPGGRLPSGSVVGPNLNPSRFTAPHGEVVAGTAPRVPQWQRVGVQSSAVTPPGPVVPLGNPGGRLPSGRVVGPNFNPSRDLPAPPAPSAPAGAPVPVAVPNAVAPPDVPVSVTPSGVARIGRTPAEAIRAVASSPEGTMGTRAEMMRQLRLADRSGASTAEKDAIIRRFEAPEYSPRERQVIGENLTAPAPAPVTPAPEQASVTQQYKPSRSNAKFDANGKRVWPGEKR